MQRRARIFKSRNMAKTAGLFTGYAWKYITGKPLIFNLNFNVTNVCNQNCPMCNAVITDDPNAQFIKIDKFKEYIDKFVDYGVASLSISGGEPSIVPGMPEMLDYAGGKFPFGISLNTNIFARPEVIRPVAAAALRNNARIGISFDGFGDVADRLRGGKDVSRKIIENMEMINQMKKESDSDSGLNMHTVLSNQNLHQAKEIFDFSEKMGWSQTMAPVNNFFYQEPIDKDAPMLHYSEQLQEVIDYASTKTNINVSKDFLINIPKFTQGQTPKLCPYLTGIFKTYKIFLDVSGDVSLCSRKAIGNINNQSIESIFTSENYKKDVQGYEACKGCWMICFVEILLATPRFYQNKIIKKML